MTILCHGDCHVSTGGTLRLRSGQAGGALWLGSSSLCTCEAARIALIGNYYPHFPPRPPTPPTAGQKSDEAPDVPLAQFQAAQAVNATHLSADGERAYQTRYGKVYEAGWQGESYGAWWPCLDGLPGDAVRIE